MRLGLVSTDTVMRIIGETTGGRQTTLERGAARLLNRCERVLGTHFSFRSPLSPLRGGKNSANPCAERL
jgi:hypothetical protein